KHPNPAKPSPVNAAANGQPPNPLNPAPIDFGKPKAEGNAIYKIDTDGFVREIFRQPVMVMSMIERNGVLLVGTGSDGLIYQVDPAAEETVVLAKVDPKQVLAMLATKDGRIVLGMSNVGGIASMSSGFADTGTFTSPVLDASQISRFGKIHLRGSLPKETGLTVATRSGNVQDPDKTGWSNWSEETSAASIAANAARAENKQTPRNTVEPVTWEAEDPNGDPVQYSIYFRTGSKAPWVLLKDKLTDTHFDWETRSVADGRYEVKIVGSDA